MASRAPSSLVLTKLQGPRGPEHRLSPLVSSHKMFPSRICSSLVVATALLAWVRPAMTDDIVPMCVGVSSGAPCFIDAGGPDSKWCQVRVLAGVTWGAHPQVLNPLPESLDTT